MNPRTAHRIRTDATAELERHAALVATALRATGGEPSNVQRHLRELLLALNVELIRRYN